MKIVKEHTHLIGKICKLTFMGITIEKEYKELFNIGSFDVEFLFDFCHHTDKKLEISLMFIDEEPITKHNITWYCLKEIGKNSNGDLHWFTLNQLLICEQ